MPFFAKKSVNPSKMHHVALHVGFHVTVEAFLV